MGATPSTNHQKESQLVYLNAQNKITLKSKIRLEATGKFLTYRQSSLKPRSKISDFTNKDTWHSVKFEFHINQEEKILSIILSQILHGYTSTEKYFVVDLKFRFN